MIDEKKIKEVARAYCDAIYGTLKEEPFIAEAFRQGAIWAQKEFINSLWHDASEAPKDYTDIIYVDGDNDVWNEDTYYADNYDDLFCKGWQSFVSSRDVVKWCYLDDIMPKGGEE